MIRLFIGPRSIAGRLTLLNVLVSGIALLLAFASFVAYDALSFQHDLRDRLRTEAQILGANTVAALQFQDQQAATATLAALHGSPEVRWAVVLGPDQRQFAVYLRDPAAGEPTYKPMPASGSDAHWRVGPNLLYGSRILFQGRLLGTIYLLASMDAQTQRARLYAAIAALVLMLCMGIALLLTSAFRRLLTDPLIALAQTAQTVRRQKDFGLRATPSDRRDEVAVLVRSFNDMLDAIQQRDRALETSRTVLEDTVQQRTAELSAANKELEAFSYTVAHDLRGPLETMANIGYLLEQDFSPQLGEEGREFLRQLRRSTRKMSSLVQDLLKLSRSSREPLHRQLVDLSETARGILRQLALSDPTRSVDLRIADDATVFADTGLLCVALENLLGNAWKYTSRQPAATIEFGRLNSPLGHPGETVFFVRDNGAGFDPAYADRLFHPFQRLHVQADFPGTGIGLTTVSRIIKRHGGSIWAEGTPHHGATFYFTVPYEKND